MADRTIKPDDTNDLVLQNNDGSAKLEINEDQTVVLTGGSSTVATITTDGNVMIDDSAELFVKGTGTTADRVKLENSGGNGKITIKNSSGTETITLSGGSGAITGTFNGTIGDSATFPGGSTGSIGGHILQVEHGLYQCTGDIAISTTSEAYGPVISMVMKTANARIFAMICHGETYSALGTTTMNLGVVYKSSSFSAGQGNTSHGATTLGAPSVNDTRVRVHNNANMTNISSGTISNSVGDTIYFGPYGQVSSGSTVAYPNFGGGYTNISIHVFELSQ